MKFNIDCKVLLEGLSDVLKSCAGAKDVSLQATNKGLVLSATNKTNVHILKLKAEVLKEGSCTLTPEYLQGILKGRQSLQFQEKDNKLLFSSTEGKAYSGELYYVPYEEHTITPVDKESSSVVKLTDVQTKALFNAYNKCNIPASYDTAQVLPVYLNLSCDGVEAYCFDEYAVSRVVDTTVSFDIDISIQLMGDTLKIITDASKGNTFNIAFVTDSIIAYNNNFKLQVPYGQSEAITKVTQAETVLTDAIEDEESLKAEVHTVDFTTLFENMSALQGDVILNFDKKSVTVGCVTSNGTVKESMPCKVKNIQQDEYVIPGVLFGNILYKVDVTNMPLKLSDKTLSVDFENKDVRYSYLCATQ